MSVSLNKYRLVFIGPAARQTAVGDYSEDFVQAVRPHFADVTEIRTAGPGGDAVRDIARYRGAVRKAIEQAPSGRVLVHAELAAGGVAAFWSIVGLAAVPVTATIHDPPQGIWWPGRTRFVARHRFVMHGLHYPLRPASRALEGRLNPARTMFALSRIGAQSISIVYPHTNVVHVPHLVKNRPTVPPAQDRPKAVGFFGHVYRGKGFEQITQIRRMLPDDIAIRIAGRGTEVLQGERGVQVVGPVDGPDEDAFFESVQAIVVPYNKRHWYADTYPASGAVAHAMAYRTPVVCTAYGALTELSESTGAVVVRTDREAPRREVAAELASAISALVNDEDRLRRIGESAERYRQACSPANTAQKFAAAWEQLLAEGGR